MGGFSAKTDEAFRACIDTENNRLNITGINTPKTVELDTDDTDTTLTSADSEYVVLIGGADNNKILAGDATTYYVGKVFKIFNASTEVVIIANGDSSTFEYLLPGATCELKCTSIATSEGAFEYSDDSISKTRYTKFFADFVNTYALAISELATGTGGGAGEVTYQFLGLDNGAGVFKVGAGTGATGFGQVYNNRAKVRIGNGAVIIGARINTITLPTASEDFIFEFGLNNNAGGTTATDEVVLFIDRTNTNQWYGRTTSSSSSTAIASVVTASTSGYDTVHAIINSDRTRVDFFVNYAHIGSSTTNIPSGDIFLISRAIGSAGTSGNRAVNLDYMMFSKYNPEGR